jgi:predicted phosphodiesterase
MSEWYQSAKIDRDSGMALRAIARKYGVAYSTVWERFEREKDRPEVVGVISDTHFPFVHPNYIHFLKDTFKQYAVTRIVHIGDLCDNHAISRHLTETDADGALTEYGQAIKCVREYVEAFKKYQITLTVGNHCLIPERQAATLGIPKVFLKGMRELWQLPDNWDICEKKIINGVLYEHGINWLGKHGALDKAINARMSCVIGHSHSFAGCNYQSNSESLIFGLNVGCGVDIDAYAMRYGKYNKNREVLGCGIVFDSANAIFVPMPDRYFRRGK